MSFVQSSIVNLLTRLNKVGCLPLLSKLIYDQGRKCRAEGKPPFVGHEHFSHMGVQMWRLGYRDEGRAVPPRKLVTADYVPVPLPNCGTRNAD
ncbi:hypothetical protein D3C85_1378610 [compost metagenome]